MTTPEIILKEIDIKKHYSQSELIITNNTPDTYNNWFIKGILDEPNTITDIKDFTISSNKPGTFILTPETKILLLKPEGKISKKIKFTGGTPINFDFSFYPKPSGDVYNLDFTKMKDIKEIFGCMYQYSYPAMEKFPLNNSPNPDYFKIEDGKLVVNVYKGDKTFKQGSPTDPRSELRFLANVYDDIEYVYSWTSTLTKYTTGDQFCFAQIFASDGPNIMLRFRNGSYQLIASRGNNKNLNLDGNPADDVGKAIYWTIRFKLSYLGGYVSIYKNNLLLGTIKGDTSGGGSYIKLGLYMQHQEATDTLSCSFRNMILTIV